MPEPSEHSSSQTPDDELDINIDVVIEVSQNHQTAKQQI
jgi:hypothetical protein